MIVTLTGPSCGGKSTLERALHARGFGRAISHTTREAREGETCGVDYHFINDITFDAMDVKREFIEKVDLGTRRYAMSKQSLDLANEQGDVVIVVDPHGAKQIAAYCHVAEMPMIPMWVDCGPQEQARRWLVRHRTQPDTPASHAAAEERLGLMLGLEQQWRREAEGTGRNDTPSRLYQYFLFSESTPAEVLAEQVQSVVTYRKLQPLTSLRFNPHESWRK